MIMPARTNSEKIESAEKEVGRQGHLLSTLEERYRTEVSDLQSNVRKLLEKAHELEIEVTRSKEKL